MPDFELLFNKFINKTCTRQEQEELFEMISRAEYDPALQNLIDAVILQIDAEHEVPETKANGILTLILQTGRKASNRNRLFAFKHWAVAASFILVVGASAIYYNLRNSPAKQGAQISSAIQDLPPGREGAVLILEDGSTVSLDSLQHGVIANQNGTTVSLNNGLISYDARNAEKVSYNTLATPRGRVFHLVLPDGSRVWLNAESSMKYPTSFNGKERIVELSGEACFEISRNEKMPFKVKLKGETEVRVLGTGFNVNAYPNEDEMKTTLLHGSVEVNAVVQGNRTISGVLKPGEQGRVSALQSHPRLQVEKTDTSQVMAWKNGIFNFENANIEIVMRQLERWDDIEVVYEKGVPDLVFGGKMERNLNLAHVLRILEISKVHFRMEGKKLIVTP